jgi:hypothetical protein
MLSFFKAWMLSFLSVEDVIIFHGINDIIFELLSFLSVQDVTIFHGVNIVIF